MGHGGARSDEAAEMSKIQKLLDKMRQSPQGLRIEQLKTVAKHYDIKWHQKRTSHCTFRAPSGQKRVIPADRPIKAVYIKQFLNLLDTMCDTENDEDDESNKATKATKQRK